MEGNIKLEEINLHDIEKSLIDKHLLYAHIDDSSNSTEKLKEPEFLHEHLERTIETFYKLSNTRGINFVLYNIIYNLEYKKEKISKEQADLIMELFINAIYLHDLGKINPAFQYKIENDNIKFENTADTSDSNHSMLSALIYIDIFLPKIQQFKDRAIKQYLRFVLLSFAYIISRHHTYLTNLGEDKFLDELKDLQGRVQKKNSYLAYYENSERLRNELKLNLFSNISKNNHEAFGFYVLIRLLYSSLVSCDFYATYYYNTGKFPEFKQIDNASEVLKIYQNTAIYRGIKAYKHNKNHFGENSINILRSEMFLEAEENLLGNIDKYNIFYLEAPTGSGKTNTSINLALNIINTLPIYKKISYIFPFNTLVEQTKKTFDEIFDKEKQKDFKVAVINSITPIVTEKEKNSTDEDESKVDYKKDYLNRQMLQYPVSLTTHVNFFNYLFGTGREINLPLIHLCNSVIIIDEVQSYRNKIWPEIIKFLNIYSKLLNLKIIIMSATLPKLDKLLHEENCGFYDLIRDKGKYYQSELFKNRVDLNFKMLTKDKISKEELLENIDKVIKKRGKCRILMEFIKKTTARDFFYELKKMYPEKECIYEITGDDSNFVRNKVLNKINEEDKNKEFICKDVIIVATQVIEAGVDIDMDIGFKDISLLDGEEQFLGRINRSCKRKNCEAFFFNYDAAEQVYREDFRLEFDLRNHEYQEYLINKNFEEFYNNCFKRLEEKKTEKNKENINNLNEDVLYLNFQKVCEKMKLIKQENYQLFLSYQIKDDKTGEIIADGTDIWNQYNNLIANKKMDYAEKKIQLSILSQRMAYFTYNFNDFDDKNDKTPKLSDDNIGRLYYIKNGQEYITEDGKFNRQKYKEDSGGYIL